jgi:branched-chain amino acid transport system substrate-binding protein
MIGGGMTGLQTTDSETILGPQINGLVNFAYWLPTAKLQFPGSMDFLSKYQARAKAEGVDPIGYYVAPWAYADLQMLAAAVEGTKSLEGDKLAAYLHGNTLNTIIGEVKYGPGGEWANPRQFLIQFQNIKTKEPSEFTGTDHLVVVGPPELKSGDLISPFDKARH